MTQYRYILQDLLSGTVLMELPMQSVTFSRRLSKPGNFQGTFGLGNAGYPDVDVLDATEPGKTALYVERTATGSNQPYLVWGGIIWSRTWQEQGLVSQITAQTFESFAYQCDARVTLDYTGGIDQRNQLRDLYSIMQAMTNRNIGVVLPTPYGTNNHVNNNIFYDYEAWTFGKIIDKLLSLENSFDYTIEVDYDDNGDFRKTLRVDDVLGTPITQSGLGFDYPGNIKNFWWPENASNGATTVFAIGNGNESSMLRTVITDSSAFARGYPDLTQFFTDKSTTDINVLTDQANAFLTQMAVPVSIPTFEVNPEMVPQFGNYQLGDYADFSLESRLFARLPNSIREGTYRIIGWDVTPSRSDSTEQVKLVITGQDNA